MNNNPKDRINPEIDGDTLEKFLAIISALDAIAAIQEINKDKNREQKVENLKKSTREADIDEDVAEEVGEDQAKELSIIESILDALYSILGIQLKDISTEEILYILICRTKAKNLQMFANLKNKEYMKKILIASILMAINSRKEIALASSIPEALSTGIGYEKYNRGNQRFTDRVNDIGYKEREVRSLNANNSNDSATHSTSVANHLSPSFNSQTITPEIKHQTSMLQENAITKQQNVWRDDGVHMQRMAVRMKDYEHDAKHQALLHRHTSIADLSGTQRDGLLITALCMSVINKAINLIKQEVYNVLSTPPTQHIKRIHHQSNSTQNHGNRSFLREPTVYYNNFNRSNITPQQIPYPKASHQQMSGSSRFDESSYNKLPDQQLPGILLMRSIVSYQALTVVTLNENTGVAIMRATTITVETSMRGGTSAVCCDTSKSNEIAR